MKKLLIASSVGAAILFVWSALAWTMLPLHHHTFKYTPNQDPIMEAINQNLDESGVYAVPNVDNRDIKLFDPEYKKAYKELQESMEGQPSSMIVYSKSWNMGPSVFLYGFLFQFILAFIASLLLALVGGSLTSFFDRWWVVMLLAVFVSVQAYLMEWNWMGFSWHYVRDMIVDVMIGWALCGFWLAYYFGRK